MSRHIYFTTDEALAAVLAEADDEFCGREDGEAPTSFPATENVVSSDDEESEGDRHHFLDDELDEAGAAAQFNSLVIVILYSFPSKVDNIAMFIHKHTMHFNICVSSLSHEPHKPYT